MLETVSARLRECGCHTMPVVHNGQVVGLVTMENIGEFLMIQSALGRPVKMLNQRWARI
jgi:predicted transcriptional regulator